MKRYRVTFITTQGKRSGYENVDAETAQAAIASVLAALSSDFGEVINASVMKLKDLD